MTRSYKSMEKQKEIVYNNNTNLIEEAKNA